MGQKPFTYPTNATLKIRSRRGSPHFELDDGLYFITFRLADSLPREVILNMVSERQRLIRAIRGPQRPATPLEEAEISALCGDRFDEYLDAGRGACSLGDPRLASIVESALKFHESKLHDLLAWCVMPNHVHVVIRLYLGSNLGRLLHSWKSFTANQCNLVLGRSGRLWQREYFDRIVRDERELHRVIEYSVRNPEKAGLLNWPFAGTGFLS